MLTIESVINYIPETKVDVEHCLEELALSPAQARVYKRIYQLQQVPRAQENGFQDFITIPLQRLFAQSNVDKKNIKYLIHTHTGRVVSKFGKSFLKDLKQQLQLSNALVFSVSLNNCASTLTAVSIAKNLLAMDLNPNARAIIITADLSFTSVLQYIPNISVMGDAATVVLVNKLQGNHQLIAETSTIHGQYAAGSWMTKENTAIFEEQYVHMVVQEINRVLAKANLKLQDIQLILPHNVNLISWEKIRSSLGCQRNKIFLKNIANYGHCFGSDIFINYCDAIAEKNLNPNDYYMMVTVGLGATVATAIFKY